jgi:TonB family protein
MALLHGSFEEKYEVLARLRQGGMGAVYKVRHRLLDELRAIKVIRSWAVGNEEAAARFLQEARVASRLRHPNLAVLHDFAVDAEGGAYLVSELIEGWTFREILQRYGPPPLALGLEMARQSLKALGALHRSRIVHRDVAPDNLMLTRDADGLPLVKLIDLGIAKALEEGFGATESGFFLGKPRYASPEQFSAGPADERSDLYSFGVVLYELLTGRCPISGHDPLSLMAGHLERPPLSFEVSDPEGKIPPDLRKILLDALEKRPEDRIPSAAEFAAAIAEIQTRYPVDKAEVETLFAIPVAAALALEDTTDVHLLEHPDHTKRTEAPLDGETGETDETAAGLYLRSSESEHTRSGVLPLALAAGGGSGATVNDITWGPVPPTSLAEPEDSPLLFRLALATAALLLLFVVARAFWRPGVEPRAKAPKFAAALHAPSPPTVLPAPAVPPPLAPEPVVPAPAPAAPPAPLPHIEIAQIADNAETLATSKETPKIIEAEEAPSPAPAHVRKPQRRPATKLASSQVQRKPATARLAATKRRAPAPPVALARRAHQPWEEGTQPPGLLKPGPGVEEPVPLSLPRFAYPSAARGTGVRADVRLALLVDERGKVIDARVREGAPPNLGFAETALAAAKRISFQPATRHEVPGKMWTEMILEFAE